MLTEKNILKKLMKFRIVFSLLGSIIVGTFEVDPN